MRQYSKGQSEIKPDKIEPGSFAPKANRVGVQIKQKMEFISKREFEREINLGSFFL